MGVRADDEGTEMNWKSFAKGTVAMFIAVLLALGAVGYLRALNKASAIEYCESAIVRVENVPISHLSELEIRACVEMDIKIPEGR
ncbi:MAG: hypothetical protein UX77_C0005G0014 [Parcubacteria group bacterium GW2011_GWA1_47_11]|uniref:Uncharacterized protein n=1 Tax=Candidatus Colwellbacteria bacterium GWA2_46_10 TaxID=1797684 RepID=A0A1G1YUS1_9BACT|nr:MAG: hypothetical protein UX29_C0009G0019 [Parcubacteria group bacterium GW2011_GWA2_46_10]KKU55985.1 MAG: hypothetical protein UX77_C0005G0014 [Parcubacteria group bacterium GW2011_GWA1_47_11]OGY56123.1 MAG: hypothetical protein A2119_02840 [Candidatus Colwellbacteria bacterium GWA2_46_10]